MISTIPWEVRTVNAPSATDENCVGAKSRQAVDGAAVLAFAKGFQAIHDVKKAGVVA